MAIETEDVYEAIDDGVSYTVIQYLISKLPDYVDTSAIREKWAEHHGLATTPRQVICKLENEF